MLGNYRVSKQLGISRVVLSSIELVSYGLRSVEFRIIMRSFCELYTQLNDQGVSWYGPEIPLVTKEPKSRLFCTLC
jgi:hypothetical protein